MLIVPVAAGATPRSVISTRPFTGRLGNVTVTGVPAAVGVPTVTVPHAPLVRTMHTPLTLVMPGGNVSVTCAPLPLPGPISVTMAFQMLFAPGATFAGPVMLIARSGPVVYGETVSWCCALAPALFGPTFQVTWAVLVIVVPTGVAAPAMPGMSTAIRHNHARKVRAIRANMPPSTR